MRADVQAWGRTSITLAAIWCLRNAIVAGPHNVPDLMPSCHWCAGDSPAPGALGPQPGGIRLEQVPRRQHAPNHKHSQEAYRRAHGVSVAWPLQAHPAVVCHLPCN